MPSWPLLFFFNDTATTEIYTLSLHDALPIYAGRAPACPPGDPRDAGRSSGDRRSLQWDVRGCRRGRSRRDRRARSEEHTSELQSRSDLVCRLLLEKKKKTSDDTAQTRTAER